MRPVPLKTIGVELELDNVSATSELERFLSMFGWGITHDASIETPVRQIEFSNIAIKKFVSNRYSMRNVRRSKTGVELLSGVTTPEKFSSDIKQICRQLTDNRFGETFESERSSFHVHVSVGVTSVNTLKNIMRISAHFEPLFFYLGGMGYTFRGETNDAIYCRPITKFGPPVVCGGNNNLYQVYEINNLLSAKGSESFWTRYGDMYNHTRKYSQPARYSWLNLMRIFASESGNTLEFRVFNKSMNYHYLSAVTNLVVQLTNYMYSVDNTERDIFAENSIFDCTKDDALNLCEQVFSLLELDEKTKKYLELIILSTPDINLDSGYVFTHKTDLAPFWTHSEWYPQVVTSSVRKPKFVDIHRLSFDTNEDDNV